MKFEIEVVEEINGVFHIIMNSQYELTTTFMRLQEFYESPYENINGQYFTMEQFMDLYAEDQGDFTYTSDWNGFNVPGEVVVKFFNIFTHIDLLKKEQKLLKTLLSNIPNFDDGNFYLIGSVNNEESGLVKNHEIAHGMFYLEDGYKRDMLNINRLNDQYVYMKTVLLKMGYCEDVIDDEIQAFLSTYRIKELMSLFENFIIDRKMLVTYRRTFKLWLKILKGNQ